jgi:DNA-directed RNA polymerase I subunit RPA2
MLFCRRSLCIHTEDFSAKLECLVFMCQKLFSFVEDKCKAESADSVMMQESMLAGHLYLQVLQDKMERWLMLLRSVIMKQAQSPTFKLTTGNNFVF